MKLIMILAIVTSFTAIAEEAKTTSAPVAPKSEAEAKRNASKEAYIKAKTACHEENKELKGKALKDCIVKKQTEAK